MAEPDHIARLRTFKHWWDQVTGQGCYSSPEARDALLLLADYDALLEAARDVAHRGPKCDCELCEEAFERLQHLTDKDL